MNLGATISYNSLSINTVTQSAGGRPSVGYVVESFEPVPPEAVGFVEKRALQDGLDASDVYLAGRLFRLVVTAYGSSQGQLWDKAQDLFEAFHPRIAYDADTANLGFLAFDFSQPTADISTWPTSTYPNGIPMRYYMRPVTPPQYVVRRDADGGIAASGKSKPFNITLLARDPRKYLQTETSVNLSTSTQTATYRGDYPTFPVVTFALSATGHSAFTIVVNSDSIVMNLTSLSSGTIVMDFADGTIIGQASQDSKWSLVTNSTPTMGEVDVGSTFRYINPTGISSATIAYREAFA